MDAETPKMKLVNPDPPLRRVDAEALAEIRALARRQDRAASLLMKLVTFAGGQVEDVLKMLPPKRREQVHEAVRTALLRSYELAERSRGAPLQGDRAHRVLATLSGALGGFGGLPTALAELPVATTLIFRAVQGVAEAHGEDPLSAETRMECLRVFGSGAPGTDDDGIDTSFLGARLTLTGPALNRLIATVAPRVAAVLGQKLAAQAVPVLGAAAGAGTNYAFIDYYVEIAHVHFGLRSLARSHDPAEVIETFHRELAALRLPIRRA